MNKFVHLFKSHYKMYAMLLLVFLLMLFVFLFCREVRLDYQRFMEADRLGDEHILREIDKYLKEQEIKKPSRNIG